MSKILLGKYDFHAHKILDLYSYVPDVMDISLVN